MHLVHLLLIIRVQDLQHLQHGCTQSWGCIFSPPQMCVEALHQNKRWCIWHLPLGGHDTRDPSCEKCTRQIQHTVWCNFSSQGITSTENHHIYVPLKPTSDYVIWLQISSSFPKGKITTYSPNFPKTSPCGLRVLIDLCRILLHLSQVPIFFRLWNSCQNILVYLSQFAGRFPWLHLAILDQKRWKCKKDKGIWQPFHNALSKTISMEISVHNGIMPLEIGLC